MITNNLKKRFITSLLLLISVIIISQVNFFLIYSVLILGVLSILEFTKLTKKIFKSRLNFALINLFFMLYIFILLSFYFLF